MKNSCIVLEGGGLRGCFSAGVMDYLLEQDIKFDHVIGVSAGACVGASFISRQKRRNYTVNVIFPSAKEYMGIKQLITRHSFFNMDYIFRKVPDELCLFDYDTALKNPAVFNMILTSYSTGKAEVFSAKGKDKETFMKGLTATSSLPFLSVPVKINGEIFMDGGVADSIPVKYAMTSHKKAVAVLTRPRGYRKEPAKMKWLIRLIFRKHREFAEAMIRRSENYNESIDMCDRLEKEGKLFVIAPDPKYKVHRGEKDILVRDAFYRHGFQLMEERFPELKKFLGIK